MPVILPSAMQLIKTVLFLLLSLPALSQTSISFDTGKVTIPMSRVIWHENLDKEQKRTDKLDGKIDQYVKLGSNDDINIQVTDALLRKVDDLQLKIERNNGDNNLKIGYLRGLRELLQEFNLRVKSNRALAPMAPLLLESYQTASTKSMNGESIVPVFLQIPYEAGEILSVLFIQNKDIREIQKIIFLKKAEANPSNIITGLPAFENEPFADSLIAVAAVKTPLEVYTYAQAGKTIQGKMIRACKDSRVQTIVKLSEITNGTLYLPLLDELTGNRITIDDIKKVAESELQYYQLLVKTQIRYTERMNRGDTPLLSTALWDMLQRKATDAFVNVMNDLHESTEAVRFRVAEPLSPQDIYYLLVSTEEVIYTSTYLNLYKRMIDRFPNRRGDSVLMTVRFDHFKKFIKMAANYNTLDNFLQSMPELRSNQLMYAFVNGLQKTSSLEDAVDVADSYGSIQNKDLQYFLKQQVQLNFETSQKQKDRRGQIIYNILSTLFKSSSDTTINLSAQLGIPPVYKVDYNSLTDDSGKVVQHVFFYGDEDGIISYRNFMGLFNNKPEWKVNTGKEWVTIQSQKGKPVVIYANLPLDYKQDLDAQAQEHLINYLNQNNINPTIVVHRGHSYHLKYTIRQMLSSSRVVMLGSCGGYQNLSKVLNVNDDAHIISTKQVGSYSVNEPILRSLNDCLRNGNNIEWIPMWQQIANSVKGDPKASELIKDYVPPHKNLGAIFIKAYRKATGEM
jgi:hypothetical protein